MNYTHLDANGQYTFSACPYSFLSIPSKLAGFHNDSTRTMELPNGKTAYIFEGELPLSEYDRICEVCGSKMHVNKTKTTKLNHLNFGGYITYVEFEQKQMLCTCCRATKMQAIPFKASNHRISLELYNRVRELLSCNHYTLKDIALNTGLNKNVIKAIDKERLQELYTVNGEKLIQPEKPAEFLGIDEFLLHSGRIYATHIIDLTTGHILWIQEGKKKQVVYDFIEHVGLGWMKNVKGVACDMNSDFSEAFREKCPHIRIVFDHFHIIKNFNDKVVSEIRKDEQKRLINEGLTEEAQALKGSKYILISNRDKLQEKDKQAEDQEVVKKGSPLFNFQDYVRKGGYEAKYDELINQNELLFTCDYIKEALKVAYSKTEELWMGAIIGDIVYTCFKSGNKHLEWFGKLLMTHHDGIVAYAKYKISSGKIEGINRKIKTIRWHAYGFGDDEYFFLKVMDASRHK